VNYQGKPKDIDMINSREGMPKMPYQSQSVQSMGELQSRGREALPQVERNSSDLYSALQQNPYAIKRNYQ
jgi:hypothetical protein